MNPMVGGTSQEIQQWVRVGLYYFWGYLFAHGINVSPNNKEFIASIIGFALTAAWTIWGSNLKNLLERVKAKSGVEEVTVKVDPELQSPTNINNATSAGITAKRSDVPDVKDSP